MTSVSTHVLDTAHGHPAVEVPVTIEIWTDGGWRPLGGAVTDADGRASGLPTFDATEPTPSRLVFAVRDYLEAHHGKAEVRVLHVDRRTSRHEITDLNVSIALAGDLAEFHLTGDNEKVLTTDAQKNAVYAFARRFG